QYHFVSAAALQPGAQSSRADLALSAQPLARQLGISEPRRHHGRLRDGVEPVRHQHRLGPLALRGRLGSGFVRSIACACYRTVAQIKKHTRVQKFQEIRIIMLGALGGVLHALRSLYWYVGNRNLKRSWLLMYFL